MACIYFCTTCLVALSISISLDKYTVGSAVYCHCIAWILPRAARTCLHVPLVHQTTPIGQRSSTIEDSTSDHSTSEGSTSEDSTSEDSTSEG